MASADEDAQYWTDEFKKLGMILSQAERLAFDPRCDRHAVREALKHGCPPDTAFLIFSA